MSNVEGRFAARQVQGDRSSQEDDYGLSENLVSDANQAEHTLLVLADGMGGHAGGARASGLAVRTFIERYQNADGPISTRLRESLEAADRAIADAVAEQPGFDGMGCTLVGVTISKHGIEWVSVGDSPLWLFDSASLRRLNADHSMAPVLADLVDAGRLTAEEAASDPKRNSLRSAVSGEGLKLVDQSSQPVPARRSDRLLLASDGLETLSEDEIAAILERHAVADVNVIADELIEAVEAVGKKGQDNTTLILFEIDRDLGPTSARRDDLVTVPVTKNQGVAAADAGAPKADRQSTNFLVWLAAAALLLIGLAIATLLLTRNNSQPIADGPDDNPVPLAQGQGLDGLVPTSPSDAHENEGGAEQPSLTRQNRRAERLEMMWRTALGGEDIPALERLIENDPSSPHVPAAQRRIEFLKQLEDESLQSIRPLETAPGADLQDPLSDGRTDSIETMEPEELGEDAIEEEGEGA